MHGHTTHNEHALFTGQLLPPLDPEEDPPSVKADALFGHFKRAGYQTMWQEDLCWTAGWGIVSDLVAEDWQELQIKLNESFVDNTGDHAKRSIPVVKYSFLITINFNIFISKLQEGTTSFSIISRTTGKYCSFI